MTAKRVSLILIAVLVVYLAIAGSQGLRLIQTGELVAIGFGLAILILPLIGLWVVWRELRFGMTVERMAKVLEAEGNLPVDDLPRTEGGRIDRDAVESSNQDATKAAVLAEVCGVEIHRGVGTGRLG